jgi:hypothetical protein
LSLLHRVSDQIRCGSLSNTHRSPCPLPSTT